MKLVGVYYPSYRTNLQSEKFHSNPSFDEKDKNSNTKTLKRRLSRITSAIEKTKCVSNFNGKVRTLPTKPQWISSYGLRSRTNEHVSACLMQSSISPILAFPKVKDN